MRHRWPLSPIPQPAESLSSFLVRTAFHHGLDPQRFARRHLGWTRLWRHDCDRSPSPALLEAAARATGQTTVALAQMTPQGAYEDRAVRSILGLWITQGPSPRRSAAPGLPYCPLCLGDSPFYRRDWRFTFVTACPRHQVRLLDGCACCGVAVQIHRQVALAQCHACGSRLDQARSHAPGADLRRDLQVQASFLQVLQTGQGLLGDAMVSASDWLLTLHGCVRLLGDLRPRRSLPLLRHQRPLERAATVRDIHALFEEWPHRFRRRATLLRLTERTWHTWFRQAPIAPIRHLLPAGQRRDRWRRSSETRLALRRVRSRHGTGWRQARAHLLLRAARGS